MDPVYNILIGHRHFHCNTPYFVLFRLIFPPINLCGDNAAMIAMVGLEKFKSKQFNDLEYPAKPRWPLDENAAFLKGAGVKL